VAVADHADRRLRPTVVVQHQAVVVQQHMFGPMARVSYWTSSTSSQLCLGDRVICAARSHSALLLNRHLV
jgi:hypothetical protein